VNERPDQYVHRLDALKRRLVEQGRVVETLIERAVDVVFTSNASTAQDVIDADEAVDQEDVRIEKEAVRLLMDIAADACAMPEQDLRMILTVVKVNNEFERIADLAVDIASRTTGFAKLDAPVPPAFRMMANSVIGIMHATNDAFERLDPDASRRVLATDDTTEAFKTNIVRDVEQRLAEGRAGVDAALALNGVAYALARMADHCTNVAEQTIYVASGKIVRHLDQQWSEPTEPGV